MTVIPTTSKYDLYLGDKSSISGYRVRNLIRDSAPLVAPRFSSGAQGQTDLDLLKSTSVDDFVGGMFKRDWTDSTMCARMVGIYNPYNAMLYPSFAPTPYITTALDTGMPVAKAEDETLAFIAFAEYITGTGYVSKLFKIDRNTTSGELTEITLPTAFTSSAGYQITGLEIHGGYLYIAASAYGSSVTNHRMKLDTEAFVNITATGTLFAELRGVLYLINQASNIYTVTNEFAAGAATYTKIDTVGRTDYSNTATDMIEFNGALWIAKPDGLFRFDGVKAVKVIKANIRQLCEYNGAIYYVNKQWLYKFDGTNVTKLQFFGYGETFDYLSLASNQDYLFFETYVPSGTFQSLPDKAGSANARRRLYSYDGVGFSIVKETEMTGLYKAPLTAVFYCNNMILEIFCLAQSVSDTAPWDIFYNVFDLNNAFSASAITSSAVLEVSTSEFDAGYPNIYKSANVFEIALTGIIAGDSLAVTYQIFDGKTWGSWNTLGTITSTTDNKIEIVDDTKMLFKRIKFNIIATLATGSTLALKGVSLRWTLQPRLRWRWQGTLAAHGVAIIDRLGAVTTQTANALNNLITKSIKSKTPLYMLTPDYTVVKTTANSAATTIVLQGELPFYTDPYLEYPLIAIKNASDVWEILRVLTVTYASDQTIITVAERAYLGITAAELTAGKEVHLCHRVYVTRLIRDSVELNDEIYDEQTLKNTQLQREFNVELTEV